MLLMKLSDRLVSSIPPRRSEYERVEEKGANSYSRQEILKNCNIHKNWAAADEIRTIRHSVGTVGPRVSTYPDASWFILWGYRRGNILSATINDALSPSLVDASTIGGAL